MVLVLGIESSCDETAVALVDDARRIHVNLIRSQHAAHAPYGGVVPEIAARAHIEVLQPMIAQALDEGGVTMQEVDAIAVTAGPGLIGGVIVGLMTAKTLASIHQKPLLAVNHLEGHALSARLSDDVQFPFLLLLVSGGHCFFARVHDVGHYEIIGGTLDDALGEAFDKCAKMMGLGYPGGPALEKFAKSGNPKAFDLPRPMVGTPGCDMSFSGLKTAVRYALRDLSSSLRGDAEAIHGLLRSDNTLARNDVSDMAASFQLAVCDIVQERTRAAFKMCSFSPPLIGEGDTQCRVGLASYDNAGGHPHLTSPKGGGIKRGVPKGGGVFVPTALVIAGGVAANKAIYAALESVAQAHGVPLIAPPAILCTDNAAMIAWAGLERFQRGERSPLDVEPRARWSLSSVPLSIASNP